MTNEQRAALVEHLRHDADDLHDFQTAADQIEADGKRIAELEAEVERPTYDGIHSCHDQRRRVACVLERRVKELEAELAWKHGYIGIQKWRIEHLEGEIERGKEQGQSK
jgi:hypothetical protein